jgi:PAS domain S-box-containing protein
MKTKEPPVADDRHQAQIAASLRLSEAKLAGILASAMDAIITVDENQRVVLFNAAAERMFRCPAADALGESLDRFIPERFLAAHREHIRVFGETKVTQRTMGKGARFTAYDLTARSSRLRRRSRRLTTADTSYSPPSSATLPKRSVSKRSSCARSGWRASGRLPAASPTT